MKKKVEQKKWKPLMQAAKIGIGSSAAIYIAESLNLQYAAAAGTIALLTIVATKWETMRLSLLRIVTFLIATALSWATITAFRSEWVAYGVYIFVIVMMCEVLGWKPTISVNAVIGTHFLSTRDFSREFILNEFCLVLIGITIAVILNLFHNNSSHKKEIIAHMRYTEERLQGILREVGAYLSHEKMHGSQSVWDDIESLEGELQEFAGEAYDYQENTFQSHPGYYIDYFEMRIKQFNILYNLHHEMKKIREIPKQAAVVAEYVEYLADYVIERNAPEEQIRRLEGIFETMRREPMPADAEEFENRAILYHILMDLEDFLLTKKRFVDGLDERQMRIYWNAGERE